MKTVWQNQDLIRILKEGGVVVMPTDTLYGIVGQAENPETVEKIYEIRKRVPSKPCIVLIGNINQLARFSINISSRQEEKLKEFWPGPVSVILDCEDDKFSYLHRGTKTLAFRIPKNEELRNLLTETGPLIAPSANTEGNNPAENILEAKNYFGDQVDLYIDGGTIYGKASKVVKLEQNGEAKIFRE